ncbi:IS1380 family transposase [Nocardiopsis exhalans]|uniref:IS1380 family transposase n=1 Tax=Nocardiopsis exhalans TaxID=163604 RepID=A0ABY5D607_9ACTN|nr:IS1380 family transposase [Nocardiopsis exhalans]USY18684.1 IS1380 family transposase [Nocardiopsis exhalans]
MHEPTWDHRLSVTTDGKATVGHAGSILLRKLADRTGLVRALTAAFPTSTATTWRDRAITLIHLAIAIVLGARNLSEAERLGLHHRPVFGAPASDSTLRRTLAALDEAALTAIAKARRAVRRHVWTLLHLRPGGFPQVSVAGKCLKGWIVLDMDATIITTTSHKEGAAPTFKSSFGFHPLAAWCANTGECLAMLLRPGNAGANTATDHIDVLTQALDQVPGSSRAKILVRIDGAGATHDLLKHLHKLNTTRRTVRFTVGWKITEADEEAIAKIPQSAWETAVDSGGDLQEGYEVAELTGLSTRQGWPENMRLIVRRVRPSRRHAKKLTELERKTGWRYSVLATDIGRMHRIAGSHQAQFLDALHRDHAEVEDRVRTNKAMGLALLPSRSWTVNRAWVLAANLACDLDAWLRLLTLHDKEDLAQAEPESIRFRLYHQSARLARHARRRFLRLERTWPWAQAFSTCWQRLIALPNPV